MNNNPRKVKSEKPQSRAPRQRGAAIILAMMFLVIFAALAAALAVVAQGNLATSDSYLKINRCLATAESGLNFLIYETNRVTATVKTRDGEVTAANAPALWNQIQTGLQTTLAGAAHNVQEPYSVGTTLYVGPVSLGTNYPRFSATFTPHPLGGENYSSAYYQRPPFSQMSPAVSNTNPLDATWIRVRVQAAEGPAGHQITRAIQMDFKLEKKIQFAILSRSRVMLGRNVQVEGRIGSQFTEANLPNGHPVQMESDFYGLDPRLDAQLDAFHNTLIANDKDGDNRLNLANPAEVAGITNPAQYDTDGDGYITEFDFFLAFYDTQKKGYLTAQDLNTAGNPRLAELFQLIDTAGDPSRPGYNDGKIDANDYYAKVHGEVLISTDLNTWQNGAAGGAYQKYFQGTIIPDAGQSPLQFQASDNNTYQFQPSDFDVSTYKSMATGDFNAQAAAQAQLYDPNNPNSPQPLGMTVFEAVPYGAAHPYDYYSRPVYQNMTFTNVMIPQGANALFKNCKFIGCTYVQTTTQNTDPMYNYVGMQDASGNQLYGNLKAVVNGVQVANTKTISNNLRFDGCTFEGSVVSDVPSQFTVTRNKVSFTGNTQFIVANAPDLTDAQKAVFSRSAILMPQYSVELGTFINPTDPTQNVQLTGTIVAGVIDMRGNINVDGTVLTTFQPVSGQGPVIGNTSPNYNVTLGYFSSGQGDLEAEMPAIGLGAIRLRYDPTLPLPDGILGPVSLTANYATYFELGAN